MQIDIRDALFDNQYLFVFSTTSSLFSHWCYCHADGVDTFTALIGGQYDDLTDDPMLEVDDLTGATVVCVTE